MNDEENIEYGPENIEGPGSDDIDMEELDPYVYEELDAEDTDVIPEPEEIPGDPRNADSIERTFDSYIAWDMELNSPLNRQFNSLDSSSFDGYTSASRSFKEGLSSFDAYSPKSPFNQPGVDADLAKQAHDNRDKVVSAFAQGIAQRYADIVYPGATPLYDAAVKRNTVEFSSSTSKTFIYDSPHGLLVRPTSQDWTSWQEKNRELHSREAVFQLQETTYVQGVAKRISSNPGTTKTEILTQGFNPRTAAPPSRPSSDPDDLSEHMFKGHRAPDMKARSHSQTRTAGDILLGNDISVAAIDKAINLKQESEGTESSATALRFVETGEPTTAAFHVKMGYFYDDEKTVQRAYLGTQNRTRSITNRNSLEEVFFIDRSRATNEETADRILGEIKKGTDLLFSVMEVSRSDDGVELDAEEYRAEISKQAANKGLENVKFNEAAHERRLSLLRNFRETSTQSTDKAVLTIQYLEDTLFKAKPGDGETVDGAFDAYRSGFIQEVMALHSQGKLILGMGANSMDGTGVHNLLDRIHDSDFEFADIVDGEGNRVSEQGQIKGMLLDLVKESVAILPTAYMHSKTMAFVGEQGVYGVETGSANLSYTSYTKNIESSIFLTGEEMEELGMDTESIQRYYYDGIASKRSNRGLIVERRGDAEMVDRAAQMFEAMGGVDYRKAGGKSASLRAPFVFTRRYDLETGNAVGFDIKLKDEFNFSVTVGRTKKPRYTLATGQQEITDVPMVYINRGNRVIGGMTWVNQSSAAVRVNTLDFNTLNPEEGLEGRENVVGRGESVELDAMQVLGGLIYTMGKGMAFERTERTLFHSLERLFEQGTDAVLNAIVESTAKFDTSSGEYLGSGSKSEIMQTFNMLREIVTSGDSSQLQNLDGRGRRLWRTVETIVTKNTVASHFYRVQSRAAKNELFSQLTEIYPQLHELSYGYGQLMYKNPIYGMNTTVEDIHFGGNDGDPLSMEGFLLSDYGLQHGEQLYDRQGNNIGLIRSVSDTGRITTSNRPDMLGGIQKVEGGTMLPLSMDFMTAVTGLSRISYGDYSRRLDRMGITDKGIREGLMESVFALEFRRIREAEGISEEEWNRQPASEEEQEEREALRARATVLYFGYPKMEQIVQRLKNLKSVRPYLPVSAEFRKYAYSFGLEGGNVIEGTGADAVIKNEDIIGGTIAASLPAAQFAVVQSIREEVNNDPNVINKDQEVLRRLKERATDLEEPLQGYIEQRQIVAVSMGISELSDFSYVNAAYANRQGSLKTQRTQMAIDLNSANMTAVELNAALSSKLKAGTIFVARNVKLQGNHEYVKTAFMSRLAQELGTTVKELTTRNIDEVKTKIAELKSQGYGLAENIVLRKKTTEGTTLGDFDIFLKKGIYRPGDKDIKRIGQLREGDVGFSLDGMSLYLDMGGGLKKEVDFRLKNSAFSGRDLGNVTVLLEAPVSSIEDNRRGMVTYNFSYGSVDSYMAGQRTADAKGPLAPKQGGFFTNVMDIYQMEHQGGSYVESGLASNEIFAMIANKQMKSFLFKVGAAFMTEGRESRVYRDTFGEQITEASGYRIAEALSMLMLQNEGVTAQLKEAYRRGSQGGIENRTQAALVIDEGKVGKKLKERADGSEESAYSSTIAIYEGLMSLIDPNLVSTQGADAPIERALVQTVVNALKEGDEGAAARRHLAMRAKALFDTAFDSGDTSMTLNGQVVSNDQNNRSAAVLAFLLSASRDLLTDINVDARLAKEGFLELGYDPEKAFDLYTTDRVAQQAMRAQAAALNIDLPEVTGPAEELSEEDKRKIQVGLTYMRGIGQTNRVMLLPMDMLKNKITVPAGMQDTTSLEGHYANALTQRQLALYTETQGDREKAAPMQQTLVALGSLINYGLGRGGVSEQEIRERYSLRMINVAQYGLQESDAVDDDTRLVRDYAQADIFANAFGRAYSFFGSRGRISPFGTGTNRIVDVPVAYSVMHRYITEGYSPAMEAEINDMEALRKLSSGVTNLSKEQRLKRISTDYLNRMLENRGQTAVGRQTVASLNPFIENIKTRIRDSANAYKAYKSEKGGEQKDRALKRWAHTLSLEAYDLVVNNLVLSEEQKRTLETAKEEGPKEAREKLAEMLSQDKNLVPEDKASALFLVSAVDSGVNGQGLRFVEGLVAQQGGGLSADAVREMGQGARRSIFTYGIALKLMQGQGANLDGSGAKLNLSTEAIMETIRLTREGNESPYNNLLMGIIENEVLTKLEQSKAVDPGKEYIQGKQVLRQNLLSFMRSEGYKNLDEQGKQRVTFLMDSIEKSHMVSIPVLSMKADLPTEEGYSVRFSNEKGVQGVVLGLDIIERLSMVFPDHSHEALLAQHALTAAIDRAQETGVYELLYRAAKRKEDISFTEDQMAAYKDLAQAAYRSTEAAKSLVDNTDTLRKAMGDRLSMSGASFIAMSSWLVGRTEIGMGGRLDNITKANSGAGIKQLFLNMAAVQEVAYRRMTAEYARRSRRQKGGENVVSGYGQEYDTLYRELLTTIGSKDRLDQGLNFKRIAKEIAKQRESVRADLAEHDAEGGYDPEKLKAKAAALDKARKNLDRLNEIRNTTTRVFQPTQEDKIEAGQELLKVDQALRIDEGMASGLMRASRTNAEILISLADVLHKDKGGTEYFRDLLRLTDQADVKNALAKYLQEQMVETKDIPVTVEVEGKKVQTTETRTSFTRRKGLMDVFSDLLIASDAEGTPSYDRIEQNVIFSMILAARQGAPSGTFAAYGTGLERVTIGQMAERAKEYGSSLAPDEDFSTTAMYISALGDQFTQLGDYDGDSFQAVVTKMSSVTREVIAAQGEVVRLQQEYAAVEESFGKKRRWDEATEGLSAEEAAQLRSKEGGKVMTPEEQLVMDYVGGTRQLHFTKLTDATLHLREKLSALSELQSQVDTQAVERVRQYIQQFVGLSTDMMEGEAFRSGVITDEMLPRLIKQYRDTQANFYENQKFVYNQHVKELSEASSMRELRQTAVYSKYQEYLQYQQEDKRKDLNAMSLEDARKELTTFSAMLTQTMSSLNSLGDSADKIAGSLINQDALSNLQTIIGATGSGLLGKTYNTVVPLLGLAMGQLAQVESLAARGNGTFQGSISNVVGSSIQETLRESRQELTTAIADLEDTRDQRGLLASKELEEKLRSNEERVESLNRRISLLEKIEARYVGEERAPLTYMKEQAKENISATFTLLLTVQQFLRDAALKPKKGGSVALQAAQFTYAIENERGEGEMIRGLNNVLERIGDDPEARSQAIQAFIGQEAGFVLERDFGFTAESVRERARAQMEGEDVDSADIMADALEDRIYVPPMPEYDDGEVVYNNIDDDGNVVMPVDPDVSERTDTLPRVEMDYNELRAFSALEMVNEYLSGKYSGEEMLEKSAMKGFLQRAHEEFLKESQGEHTADDTVQRVIAESLARFQTEFRMSSILEVDDYNKMFTAIGDEVIRKHSDVSLIDERVAAYQQALVTEAVAAGQDGDLENNAFLRDAVDSFKEKQYAYKSIVDESVTKSREEAVKKANKLLKKGELSRDEYSEFVNEEANKQRGYFVMRGVLEYSAMQNVQQYVGETGLFTQLIGLNKVIRNLSQNEYADPGLLEDFQLAQTAILMSIGRGKIDGVNIYENVSRLAAQVENLKGTENNQVKANALAAFLAIGGDSALPGLQETLIEFAKEEGMTAEQKEARLNEALGVVQEVLTKEVFVDSNNQLVGLQEDGFEGEAVRQKDKEGNIILKPEAGDRAISGAALMALNATQTSFSMRQQQEVDLLQQRANETEIRRQEALDAGDEATADALQSDMQTIEAAIENTQARYEDVNERIKTYAEQAMDSSSNLVDFVQGILTEHGVDFDSEMQKTVNEGRRQDIQEQFTLGDKQAQRQHTKGNIFSVLALPILFSAIQGDIPLGDQIAQFGQNAFESIVSLVSYEDSGTREMLLGEKVSEQSKRAQRHARGADYLMSVARSRQTMAVAENSVQGLAQAVAFESVYAFGSMTASMASNRVFKNSAGGRVAGELLGSLLGMSISNIVTQRPIFGMGATYNDAWKITMSTMRDMIEATWQMSQQALQGIVNGGDVEIADEYYGEDVEMAESDFRMPEDLTSMTAFERLSMTEGIIDGEDDIYVDFETT